MSGRRWRIWAAMVAAVMVILMAAGGGTAAAEETEKEYQPLIVTANVLNGRMRPSKRAEITARFDQGDEVQPTGRISKDWEWVEVYGGENGTAWVHYKYVTERVDAFRVTNENNGRVKARKRLGGKARLTGYIGHGKTIEIDQVILGWGHCKRGWVDLEYFIEEVEWT